MNNNDAAFIAFMLFIIVFAFLFSAAMVDLGNPGEICTERNFGAEAWVPPEDGGHRTAGENYYCLRLVNGTPEARPLEWVEQNCGNNGVCDDG